MLDKDDKLFQDCVDKWGLKPQVDMAVEEMGEVIEQLGSSIKSINQYNRCRINTENVIEEFVDVYLMMQQMRFMNKEIFDRIYEQKVNRIRERLMK